MNDRYRPDIAALGRITTVWAHPDDESYLAGGLMAMARCLGQPVTCVTATPGDLAPTEAERAHLGCVRRAELTAALARLGVHDTVVLGLPDGGCAAISDEVAVEQIAAVLRRSRPDTVVTFGADGVTGHPDHRAVSRWTMAAVAAAWPHARVLVPATTAAMVEADRDITERFPIFEPGLPAVADPAEVTIALRLGGCWLDRKVAALRAHASQTSALIGELGEPRFRRWVAVEQFVTALVPVRRAASSPVGCA
jgi:LmbE family N-acetylglucosaminyl deacetylase